MQAFTNVTMTKPEMMKALKWHQKQDNFVKGSYWDNGKGCAVGCSLESVARIKSIDLDKGYHKNYETHLGVPEWLARVEDRLFEGIGKDRSKVWPVEFMEAINVGADLDKIKLPFLAMIVESSIQYVDVKKFPELKSLMNQLHTMLDMGLTDNKDYLTIRDKIYTARRAADADAAADAAAYAAYAADAYAAADAADAYAAADAADAYAAADAADADADAAAYAAYAARRAKYEYFADKLLELIKNCKAE